MATMRLLTLLAAAIAVFPHIAVAATSKRGLVYISNTKHSGDDVIWTQPTSDLTWYYNYGDTPSPDLAKSKLQFVPMLWGSSSSRTGTEFTDTVKSLVSQGQNITYVLAYNEPDEDKTNGGSDTATNIAASTWIREIEPLRKTGIKLGGPAVTGSSRGLAWLADFLTQCKGGCTMDFLPLHWYGDFQGMADFIGQTRQLYPNLTLWMTEFALPQQDENATQAFFNASVGYLDRLDYFARYSYFGAFRSDASNVGPNVAMLDQKGAVTDIGSWYLGSGITVRKTSGAGKTFVFGGWVALFVLFIFYTAS